MIQWFKDVVLEIRIEAALNRLLNEPNRDRQREIAGEMAELCRLRSPQQVARMEAKAGLR